jgi:hypothetical protein
MFLAAFTSALQAKPQAVQAKCAWLSRDFPCTCPHAEQRWLVNAGLNRIHPAFGIQTSPVLRLSRRTSHWRPRRPTIRNPSSRPALRHDGRLARLPGSKNAFSA